MDLELPLRTYVRVEVGSEVINELGRLGRKGL